MSDQMPAYMAPLVAYVDHEQSYTRLPGGEDVVRLVMRDLRKAQGDLARLTAAYDDVYHELQNHQMGGCDA